MLDAAYAILVGVGLAGFSIEAVATRSGVARTTIYRWWPSKGSLAIESFLEGFRPQLTYADSGSSADDFRTLLQSLARALGGPAGQVAASVVAQAQSDDETRRAFRDAFSEPLRRSTAALLRAGVDSGELRSDLDVPRVIDAAVGALYFRLLTGQSLDRAWAAHLADTLLRGCLAPSVRR